MNEQLSKDASNLRALLDTLATEFSKAAENDRQEAWAKAAHSIIDLFACKKYLSDR